MSTAAGSMYRKRTCLTYTKHGHECSVFHDSWVQSSPAGFVPSLLCCYGSRWRYTDRSNLVIADAFGPCRLDPLQVLTQLHPRVNFAGGSYQIWFYGVCFLTRFALDPSQSICPVPEKSAVQRCSVSRFLPVDRVVVHLPLLAHLWSFLARSYSVRTGRVGRPRIVRPVSFSPSAQYVLFF